MPVWIKRSLWFIGTLFLLLLTLFVLLSYVLDEPLRAYLEKRINKPLEGYRVTVEDVDVNPLGPSVMLRGVALIQEEHPEPPLAYITSLNAGVHWRPILRGRIVGQIELFQPELYIDRAKLREVVSGQEKEKGPGWQEAVRSVHPLELNLLTVTDGRVTYIDQDPDRPLRMEQIFLSVSNLRNFEIPEAGDYPSPFEFEARVFDDGKLQVQGEADFMAEPHVTGIAEIDVENISLSHFAPVLSRYDIYMSKGRLDATGNVAYTPDGQRVHLESLHVQDLLADYIYTEPAEADSGKGVEAAEDIAKEVSDHPEFLLRIDNLKVEGDVGVVNKTTDPSYRVHLVNTDLRIDNFSNQFEHGPAELNLNGYLMGSGHTTITGTFRPEDKGPDFDMNIRIEGTQLTAMNDLFRAYGNFDISAGTFSLFSEVRVKNGELNGYIKPLFHEVEVFDGRDEEEKNVFREMYESLVEGVVSFLTRQPEDRIAGKTEISGKIEDPDIDTWQLVLTILRNAFLKAILPGFEYEISE